MYAQKAQRELDLLELFEFSDFEPCTTVEKNKGQ